MVLKLQIIQELTVVWFNGLYYLQITKEESQIAVVCLLMTVKSKEIPKLLRDFIIITSKDIFLTKHELIYQPFQKKSFEVLSCSCNIIYWV